MVFILILVCSIHTCRHISHSRVFLPLLLFSLASTSIYLVVPQQTVLDSVKPEFSVLSTGGCRIHLREYLGGFANFRFL